MLKQDGKRMRYTVSCHQHYLFVDQPTPPHVTLLTVYQKASCPITKRSIFFRRDFNRLVHHSQTNEACTMIKPIEDTAVVYFQFGTIWLSSITCCRPSIAIMRRPPKGPDTPTPMHNYSQSVSKVFYSEKPCRILKSRAGFLNAFRTLFFCRLFKKPAL
jgi:hypothetical protein